MTDSPTDGAAVLHGFVLDEVLSEDSKTRSAALLGHYADDEPGAVGALILIEKTHFERSFFESLGGVGTSANGASKSSKTPRTVDGPQDAASSSKDSSAHRGALERAQNLGQNDIYTWLLGWTASTDSSPADVKLTLIKPTTQEALDKQVAKHRAQSNFIVSETPDIYAEKIEPWIQSQPPSRIQWVYNILDKKKESESILYEDTDPHTGFIILPDLKWDQRTLSSLHLTAIVHDRSIRSLRDLRPEAEQPRHAELLRKVRDAAQSVVAQKFGLRPFAGGKGSPLRCFLHYHPTYYHLHVHILSADTVLAPGALACKAHALDDVLDQLALGVDYRKRTLPVALGSKSELWQVMFGK